jgi:hypothetical protein
VRDWLRKSYPKVSLALASSNVQVFDVSIVLSSLPPDTNPVIVSRARGSSVFYRHLQEEALTRVERLVEGGRRYLSPSSKGYLVKRWGLIVPDDFPGLLRAV